MSLVPVVRVKLVKEGNVRTSEKRYSSPEQVTEMARTFFDDTDREIFAAFYLNGKNQIAGVNEISVGSLNQSIVHPREVFKGAILANAAAVILVHNHPTGDPTPSNEDKEITRRLRDAGDILGIRVLDHVIVGEEETNQFYSFTQHGLL